MYTNNLVDKTLLSRETKTLPVLLSYTHTQRERELQLTSLFAAHIIRYCNLSCVTGIYLLKQQILKFKTACLRLRR